MINTIKRNLNIIVIGSVVLLIMFFTLQSSSDTMALSSDVTGFVRSMAARFGFGDSAWICESGMRRLAHVAEYGFLGIVTMSILSYRKSLYYSLPIATMVCALVSYCDQLIKGYLPTREFDFYDLHYDLLGYAIGICAIFVLFASFRFFHYLLLGHGVKNALVLAGKQCCEG